MKILTVVGARPQFIKAALVSEVLNKIDSDVFEILVHTGQHYDQNMSSVFFDELGISSPKYQLGIGGGSHGMQTGRMLEAIEHVCDVERPDGIVVYGDTNSTLAAALAGVKLHIPIAHVEAGLRSNNRKMPEEINRLLTDHMSDILFAPTDAAVRNLNQEGISGEKIVRTGDVMYDAALRFRPLAEQTSDILSRLGVSKNSYILVTVHRAENTDNESRLLILLQAMSKLANQNAVIFPMHPRTRKIISENKYLSDALGAVQVVEPLGYLDFLTLTSNAMLVATDSGGVQKEAYFHRIPCITLRDETEWVELVESGWNKLVPPSSVQNIVDTARSSIMSKGRDVNLYGDGSTATLIASSLLERWRRGGNH